MDTITLKLLRLNTLEQLVPLLQMNVANIKLVKAKQDTIIFDLKMQVGNLESIVLDYEQMVREYETIMGAEIASCKVEKKRIRKRLLLLGGSGTIGGIVLGLVIGIIAN
jgi:hypothetical protein